MRVAVLSFDDPWESSHGGSQRTLLFLQALRSLGHDAVCVFAGGADCEEARAKRTASGCEWVQAAGASVGDGKLGRGRLGVIKRRYFPLPTVSGGQIAALHAALRDAGPWDLLLTQQIRGVPYLGSAPGAQLWLDQTDLWSHFLENEAARVRGLRRQTALVQRRVCIRNERSAGASAVFASAAGYGDANRLGRIAARPVVWLPSAVIQLPDGPTGRDGSARPTAGLLGNFRYWPNVDAFRLLAESWLTPLRQAGWRVLVAGYGSDDLPEVDGIEILGPIESPVEFYERVDVTLAPLRLGAGIKIKVLESLVAGRPVFATQAALDGFRLSEIPGARQVDEQRPHFPSPGYIGDSEGLLLAGQGADRFSVTKFTDSVAEVLAGASGTPGAGRK